MTQRAPAPLDIQAAARALLAGASIEISGRDLNKASQVAAVHCRGRQVFLPCTPNVRPEDMLAATSFACNLGLLPVPHVVARAIESESVARDLLAGLSRAGAEAVLLIGGDVRDPRGPYRSSLELLRSGLLQAAGIRKFGVASYPEGHPSIDDDVLSENLELKLEHAHREGLEVFIVSQFCFEAKAILKWARRLRLRDITAPLHVGVVAPTNASKLLQLALRCGVGNSIRALKGRMSSMVRLVATHEPDELIHDLAAGLLAARDLEPLSLHLFALGGIEATARWMSRASGDRAKHLAEQSIEGER